MQCACAVETDMDLDDIIELVSILTPFAKRVEICNECNRDIPVNEDYRKEIFIYYDEREIHRTCEDCLSIREVFFSNGHYYNLIREMIINFIEDSDGDISVKCIKELTKPARDFILDEIEKFYNSNKN